MSHNNNYNGNGRDGNFTITIDQKFGIIAQKNNGWTKEFNMVSWNGNESKFDIREWDETHKRMTKGVTFTRDELDRLYGMMKNLYEPAASPAVPSFAEEPQGGTLSQAEDLPEYAAPLEDEPQDDFAEDGEELAM